MAFRTGTTRTIGNVTLDLNDAELVEAFEDAFVESNEALGTQFDREITKAKWYWPSNPTPRDIVDDGILRQSYEATPGRTVFDHAWNVDYAMAVHEGALFGATADGPATGGFPGRPWTEAPLERLPQTFQKLAKARLGRVK